MTEHILGKPGESIKISTINLRIQMNPIKFSVLLRNTILFISLTLQKRTF